MSRRVWSSAYVVRTRMSMNIEWNFKVLAAGQGAVCVPLMMLSPSAFFVATPSRRLLSINFVYSSICHQIPATNTQRATHMYSSQFILMALFTFATEISPAYFGAFAAEKKRERGRRANRNEQVQQHWCSQSCFTWKLIKLNATHIWLEVCLFVSVSVWCVSSLPKPESTHSSTFSVKLLHSHRSNAVDWGENSVGTTPTHRQKVETFESAFSLFVIRNSK